MSDFGEAKTVTGRKAHRCEACYCWIPKGEPHHHFKGMFDGEWQDWRMHDECYKSYCADGCEEFTPGDFPVPERIKQHYAEVIHVAN